MDDPTPFTPNPFRYLSPVHRAHAETTDAWVGHLADCATCRFALDSVGMSDRPLDWTIEGLCPSGLRSWSAYVGTHRDLWEAGGGATPHSASRPDTALLPADPSPPRRVSSPSGDCGSAGTISAADPLRAAWDLAPLLMGPWEPVDDDEAEPDGLRSWRRLSVEGRVRVYAAASWSQSCGSAPDWVAGPRVWRFWAWGLSTRKSDDPDPKGRTRESFVFDRHGFRSTDTARVWLDQKLLKFGFELLGGPFTVERACRPKS